VEKYQNNHATLNHVGETIKSQ